MEMGASMEMGYKAEVSDSEYKIVKGTKKVRENKVLQAQNHSENDENASETEFVFKGNKNIGIIKREIDKGVLKRELLEADLIAQKLSKNDLIKNYRTAKYRYKRSGWEKKRRKGGENENGGVGREEYGGEDGNRNIDIGTRVVQQELQETQQEPCSVNVGVGSQQNQGYDAITLAKKAIENAKLLLESLGQNKGGVIKHVEKYLKDVDDALDLNKANFTFPKVRTMWSPAEDRLLKIGVQLYGANTESWPKIAVLVPGRTNKACRKRWFHSLDPTLHKGPWSAQEDELLKYWVEMLPGQWSKIAKKIKGRTDDQCAKRWRESLDPTISRKKWEPHEDELLIQKFKELGAQWQKIASFFVGRPGLHCRNRWRKIMSFQGLEIDELAMFDNDDHASSKNRVSSAEIKIIPSDSTDGYLSADKSLKRISADFSIPKRPSKRPRPSLKSFPKKSAAQGGKTNSAPQNDQQILEALMGEQNEKAGILYPIDLKRFIHQMKDPRLDAQSNAIQPLNQDILDLDGDHLLRKISNDSRYLVSSSSATRVATSEEISVCNHCSNIYDHNTNVFHSLKKHNNEHLVNDCTQIFNDNLISQKNHNQIGNELIENRAILEEGNIFDDRSSTSILSRTLKPRYDGISTDTSKYLSKNIDVSLQNIFNTINYRDYLSDYRGDNQSLNPTNFVSNKSPTVPQITNLPPLPKYIEQPKPQPENGNLEVLLHSFENPASYAPTPTFSGPAAGMNVDLYYSSQKLSYSDPYHLHPFLKKDSKSKETNAASHFGDVDEIEKSLPIDIDPSSQGQIIPFPEISQSLSAKILYSNPSVSQDIPLGVQQLLEPPDNSESHNIQKPLHLTKFSEFSSETPKPSGNSSSFVLDQCLISSFNSIFPTIPAPIDPENNKQPFINLESTLPPHSHSDAETSPILSEHEKNRLLSLFTSSEFQK
ncbi:Transcriptional activator Myb [Zancudomyces culisetae]|uniref:Transcriptional activator Myb n=1 Tax=Zancudomyces culisetae TaxID=1213189 RepID=A0A1R1PNR6_ZANCU|nr:Transcriptional activator Myb [Zancudomyces culisetae]|eukprot:OMH82607.1 Transcriptional activator Myb [Zancudomyces culisetae]